MSSNVPPAGPRKRRAAAAIKHGTNYAYNQHGCRCQACRQAHSDYQRRSGVNLRQGKRGEYKRHWDKENRGYCACGARCGRQNEQCSACRARARREARDRRRGIIAELYLAGVSLQNIADLLDTSRTSIGVEMVRMRDDGWDLPYRYRGYDRTGVA